ncbi:hypothetical protein BHE74_00019068 [Ensete ventricosum]|nr:hypothetical protein BHE74_00019068 [Ensete ventricosum]
MTRFVDDLPRFSPESDQALLGDVARCPTPTPSASVCSFPDPDTLSSDSIDSLRVQLRLVNQRIDNVHKTIRTKDEHGESPLCGSPFLQEIKDTPIPQHFHLTMLEAYDGGSDPIEHVAAFQTQMALYGTSDTIMSNRRIPPRDERANQYVTAETLVAEKRKDQKRPRAEPSRGPPPGFPGRGRRELSISFLGHPTFC